MKVTVERAQLLKSLGHVHRVVERRNTIPILANVLIRAEKSSLNLKATDLDLEVIESIAAEVAPGGSTTVPAHMFYEIVRKLPDGSQVVLEASGDRAVLAIRAGRSRFTLQTLPESDFPDLAAGDMTHKFTLSAADVKKLINKTQFAISTEETRHYLNGIFLHATDVGGHAMLRAVATDGHRLAHVEVNTQTGIKGESLPKSKLFAAGEAPGLGRGPPVPMRLIAVGKSLSEIAWMVRASYKTVANTSSLMRQKLGVRSSAELMRLAIDNGLGARTQ